MCLVYLVERLVVVPPLLCVAGENDPIALPAHVERLRGKGFKRGQDAQAVAGRGALSAGGRREREASHGVLPEVDVREDKVNGRALNE